MLQAHGLRIHLPRGWSGRVFARSGGLARLHAGDFELPMQDGEFGDRGTALMPPHGTFLALAEYAPGRGLVPGHGLFAPSAIPLPLDPAQFSARGLAHPRAGQQGVQHFFTRSGRPFCLYAVVAGGRSARRAQLLAADAVLATLRIEGR
jgi:hypothetical protein